MEIKFEAIKIFAIIVISFLIAFLSTPIWLRIVKALSFGKQIRQDGSTPVFTSLHKKKEGTPTMGGVVIWGAVLIVALVFFVTDQLFDRFSLFNFISRPETYLPLAALLIAGLLGFLDDILGVFKIGPFSGGLKIKHKLMAYTILGLLGAWWFYFILQKTTLNIPFYGLFDFEWFYFPLFMLVIISSTFAANETDGLDGLYGGVALFAFGAYTAIAFANGQYHLAAMCGAIAGAVLAFLWFNIHPAKLFMGDTGSMALGMTLGVTAVLTDTVFLLPLFAIIPVLESMSVIAQMFSKKLFKQKIFLSTPIHHHFEAIGWPESQVTMRFWIISIVSVGIGLTLFFLDKIY